MFTSNVLLSLFLIALTAVDASPVRRQTGKATLSFATKVRNTGLNIPELDRARAQAMRNAPHFKSGKAQRVSYTAQVGIGASDYTLLIDTGSSNTWIGADKSYMPGPDSQDTGNTVSVSYGSGSFSGEEFIDTVVLGSISISQQSIGVASTSNGLASGIDGILGVGPVRLTLGTVSNTDEVPTVMNNLYSQGQIDQELLGVYFVPVSDASTGELAFGEYDSSVTTGDVTYVPITTTSPATTPILSLTAGIVDTGTTLLLLATGVPVGDGCTLDQATGLLTITADQYDSLQSLFFNIGGSTYEFTANAQIWPRSLNSDIGGSASSIYLVVSDMGTSSGSGLDFMNGYVFLERFYSIYDTTNAQVGFATTAYTSSTSN
ncbi:acid protease [Melanogaster broomeanus]|nr:acid protease [Melanogaster broomeanus]